MSYFFLFLPEDAQKMSAYYAELTQSVVYNEFQFKRYKHLYTKYRRTWKFKAALFAWVKMHHYERCMYEAQVNELLF